MTQKTPTRSSANPDKQREQRAKRLQTKAGLSDAQARFAAGIKLPGRKRS